MGNMSAIKRKTHFFFQRGDGVQNFQIGGGGGGNDEQEFEALDKW